MPESRRRRAASALKPLALAATIAAAFSFLAAPPAGADPGAPPLHSAADQNSPQHFKDVIANLWEWNWPSVAKECTDVLGPNGYAGVQVAPPQDSLARDGHPWWEVYQPVDYGLTSRMGNEEQFKAMVSACRAAGVKVYVDAVINHTTGQGDLSYGGVSYTHYSYPDYGYADFHHYPADCPEPDNGIHDWNGFQEVTHCELLGLADLRTESDSVRSTLAGYLNKLIGYGVSGFRVDAAKHIGQTDLAALEARLRNTVDGDRPYMALEVFPGSTGQLAPEAFEGQGSLLGFDTAYELKSAFTGSIAALKGFGAGLLPSGKELAFVQNHDTERNGSTLSYKDAATNVLATQFLLASGYGTPQVYSAFRFNGGDDSPPSDTNGYVTDTDCATTWACVDREPAILHMVAWHNAAAGADVANWYDDGANLIAFSRANKAWVAINNGGASAPLHVHTGMPPGTYCDVISGASVNGACTGGTVTVDSLGFASVSVPAKGSLAFTLGDRVRG
ncbi:alpha-amylase family protein [Sinomonas sp. JGH33]|uniref:Alpha-amylase n=1 Tax=Sinomonas terricola TaxID=3110330 RepID=A0ABU5T5X6_9MICC|nr:alpha-amylase family protein [Sinomonas sp. JGH33]MEA5455073.1 alpha-amylase family protein [Sinomonas sp. JGH33]